jgi:hypothetical protein
MRLVQHHQQHEAESINIINTRPKQHHQHEADTTSSKARGWSNIINNNTRLIQHHQREAEITTSSTRGGDNNIINMRLKLKTTSSTRG